MDLTRIEIDRAVRETQWAGDPAIDIGASDIAAWEKTGDGLIPREKEKPATIRWRPLDAAEKTEVRAYRGPVRGYLILCCAYGLVSVDGMRLERKREGLLSPILSSSLTSFEAIGDDEYYPARVPAVNERLEPVVGENGEQIMAYISPLEWLGGLISKASFRERG